MTPSRRSVEEIAAELKMLAERGDSERDRLALLHEVQVYQEELIVQNEALSRALFALEETRDQFVELYDFSPYGYLTLDAHGIVLRINLTGAQLLGKHRNAIEGMPLLGYVASSHRPPFLHFLRECRACQDGGSLSVELLMAAHKSRKVRHAQLLCRPRTDTASGHRQFLTAMIDVTERKRLEEAQERGTRERAALTS